MRNINTKKGVTLLIAVIVAGIIVSIGVSLANTAIKEVIFSSTGRNSITAFYMADAGYECSLYWENVRGDFRVGNAFEPAGEDGPPRPEEIECMGIKNRISLSSEIEFWLREEEGSREPCVFVERKKEPVDNGSRIVTTSWGFNTCDESNDRRVDRALIGKYTRYE